MSAFASLILACALIGQERRTPVVLVVEKAGPAVVSIGAEIVDQNPFQRGAPNDDAWRNFFGDRRERERAQGQKSLGSGVIIGSDGVILTNEHVVARATSITVTLRDRRTFEAEVVGADPAFDIAVLKIKNVKDLPTVALGTSADLMPGETVVAIGNPFGLSNTVTTGVISALHRSVPIDDRAYEDFVQTDAAINPGNSGGALLNIEGKLVGINTAIHGGGTGIGFAIPIDKARAVVEEVVRYGEVRPAYLGVSIDPTVNGGARVIAVDAGGPAEQAGLRLDDLIVDVGGQEVADSRAFRLLSRSLIPGTKTRFGIARGGAPMQIDVTVKELTPQRAAELGRARLGISLVSERGTMAVSAVRPGTDAARIGLKKGDLVLSLAGRAVRNADDFDKLCAAIRDADAVSLILGRGGRRYYVTLELH